MPKAKPLILPAGRSSIGKSETWPLPAEAARVLGQVAPTSIPVLCLGARGTAFGRIVSGLHRSSGRTQLCRIDLSREGTAALLGLPRGRPSAYLTLALDGVENLDDQDQRTLASYLDDAAPRLVSASRASPDQLESLLDPELWFALGTVQVETPALADRPAEIPALAEARLAVLAEELSISVPRLSAPASQALASHDWPGDVTELDAVLLGTLLLEEAPDVVLPEHLAWRRTATPPPAAPIAPGTAEPGGASPAPTRSPKDDPPRRDAEPIGTLESLAVELAHQIKNPLVPVKTFISRAPRTSDREMEELRETALEGIDQIDSPLSQLSDFSRLGSSTEETIRVDDELRRCLSQVGPILDAKSANVDPSGADGMEARGNAENLSFALSVLCHHVADTIEPHSILAFTRPAPELVSLHYRESQAASHLRSVTAQPDSSFPLALLLVRGALTRMGGGLRTSRSRDEVTIELSFTLA